MSPQDCCLNQLWCVIVTAFVTLVLNLNMSLKNAKRCKHALIRVATSVIFEDVLGIGNIFEY